MKINNTNNMNNIKYINNYKANEEKSKNTAKSQNSDKCEISSVGKILNHFSIEENNLGIKDNKDVEIIKKQIAEGKYKVDTRALAEKLMSHMKGKI